MGGEGSSGGGPAPATPAEGAPFRWNVPAELGEALVAAFQAADSETSWFLDRRRTRVVTVKRGVVSDPLLRARQVEDDEIRFVEIPAVTEAEIHDWMEEFADESPDPAVGACLDQRAGANERFETKLAALPGGRLTEWHRHRLARLREVVDAWAVRTLAEPIPGGDTGAGDD